MFNEALKNGPEAVDEKKLASVGGGFSLKKAAVAAGVIGATVGGAYLIGKHYNEGKGMDTLKTGADKAKGQIDTWFSKPKHPGLEIDSGISYENPGSVLDDTGINMDFN